jgi:3-phenylpropionate/trans-cinnamate dioxygenase ferredoxin subunit
MSTRSDPARRAGHSGRSEESSSPAAVASPAGFEPVAEEADLAERGLLPVRLSNGTPVCLYRLHGEVGAVHDNCTHADFPMSDGELRPDGTIECVWHGAKFDCRTGAVCRGPADEPLPVYDVKVEGGKIHVALRRAAR